MLKLDEISRQEIDADQAVLDPEADQKQRRQMLIALGLLLIALVLVLIKDRDFWFPSSPATEAEQSDDADNTAATTAENQAPPATPVVTPSSSSKSKHPAKTPEPQPQAPDASLAPEVSNRTVLPPLEVEVVAGDEHRVIRPGSSAVSIDLQPKTPVAASSSVSRSAPSSASASTSSTSTGVTASAERVHLSPGAVEMVSRPVEPTYPLLAKQMKVQGAVVLQALIGKEGNIQDLHVLSGPAILSAAAREAVKQWRFRPYLQSGQAVETEARITVNFTISTQ